MAYTNARGTINMFVLRDTVSIEGQNVLVGLYG